MKTIRLTAAQALIKFLKNQYVHDGNKEQPFFAGCFGIFGHGNLAGIGQALQENPDFVYYQARNEQAMVHTAVAYARMKNRRQAFVCTSSIGPGATNMVTGAALATINRLPVLLLPGDIFARRNVAPVLQQLESEHSQDVSVNDCFKPVSRYWDRINRVEQLLTALPEAMRVLTSPVETGAVVLAMPQDVQTEAGEFPAEFFQKRVWTIARPRADEQAIQEATELITSAKKPMIIAGGGVIYSDATEELRLFAERSGIPVAETQAGKGSLPTDHPMSVGAVGVTGTLAANLLARGTDLVIGVGTRYSDFTTASKTAFADKGVRFININVCAFDSYKHNALPIVADAKVTLDELSKHVRGKTDAKYQKLVEDLRKKWIDERDRLVARNECRRDAGAPNSKECRPDAGAPNADAKDTLSQAEVIGIVNEFSQPQDVVVCAAGSLPGDLHKLWNARQPRTYHVEYGYSCMGYEIAGGLGVKMAAPEREVYVMVGDGSYLMMAQEIITAIQEGIKLNIILIDNHGFASIGGLSTALGSGGFGTQYRYRGKDGQLSGDYLPVDLVANAKSMGAETFTARTSDELQNALKSAKKSKNTSVIVVMVDATKKVGGYETWWDVPVAETSTMASVQNARSQYEKAVQSERAYFDVATAKQLQEV